MGTAQFTYTVRQLLHKQTRQPYPSPHYEIAKFGDDSEPEEVYDVILYARGTVFCNCLGFRRQKAPKHLHKHVRLVQLFRQLKEPPGAVFVIEPDGEPKLIGNMLE